VVLGQGEELELPLPEQPAERPELGDTAAHPFPAGVDDHRARVGQPPDEALADFGFHLPDGVGHFAGHECSPEAHEVEAAQGQRPGGVAADQRTTQIGDAGHASEPGRVAPKAEGEAGQPHPQDDGEREEEAEPVRAEGDVAVIYLHGDLPLGL